LSYFFCVSKVTCAKGSIHHIQTAEHFFFEKKCIDKCIQHGDPQCEIAVLCDVTTQVDSSKLPQRMLQESQGRDVNPVSVVENDQNSVPFIFFDGKNEATMVVNFLKD